jgi:hypothetical protein
MSRTTRKQSPPTPTARVDERIAGLQRTGRVTAEAADELRARALADPAGAEQAIASIASAPVGDEPGSAADMAKLFGGRT